MAKTQDDLIRRALQVLGVVSADEPISAENHAAASELIEPMLDDLRLRAVFDNGIATSFDDGNYLYLANILASHCARHFGAQVEPELAIEAESVLRKQQQRAYNSSPVRFLSF